MDHVVYVDYKAQELESLLNGSKTMILRGASGRKLPHGRVNTGDTLYFIRNNGEGLIKAKATVKSVFNSEKMDSSTSTKLVDENMGKLKLSDQQYKRFAGKRYLVLIEVSGVKEVEPFEIDRSKFGNMDDWLPVGDIEEYMK